MSRSMVAGNAERRGLQPQLMAHVLDVAKNVHERVTVMQERNLGALAELQRRIDKLQLILTARQNEERKQEPQSAGPPQSAMEPEDDANAEFKSVFETFKCRRCSEMADMYKEYMQQQGARLSQQQAVVEQLQADIQRTIQEHAALLEDVWKSVKKLKETASEVYEQNKRLQERLRPLPTGRTVLRNVEGLGVHLICVETSTRLSKMQLFVEEIKKHESTAGTAIAFVDEPVSNEDIAALGKALAQAHMTEVVTELAIANGYTSSAKAIIELVKMNRSTLRKLSITNTLMEVTAIVSILETLAREHVFLHELDLASNKLQESDIELLAKPIAEARVSHLNMQQNNQLLRSIEKFCAATKNLPTLQTISVGTVYISEQKELLWRTDYPKLIFKPLNTDYYYV